MTKDEDKPTRTWKERGAGKSGSRLSSVAEASEAERVSFAGAVAAFTKAAGELQYLVQFSGVHSRGIEWIELSLCTGTRVAVSPNGYCWMWAWLVAVEALEDPASLTPQDVAVGNELVRMMQTFLEAELRMKRRWCADWDEDQLEKVRRLPLMMDDRGGGPNVLSRYLQLKA